MKNKSESSGDNDDESISSDGVDVTTVNSTNQPLPPIKAINSNNTRNESTHINIDDEQEPNYRDIFKEKSHLEITKWLEKRNLGKLQYLTCHNQSFKIFLTKYVICIK